MPFLLFLLFLPSLLFLLFLPSLPFDAFLPFFEAFFGFFTMTSSSKSLLMWAAASAPASGCHSSISSSMFVVELRDGRGANDANLEETIVLKSSLKKFASNEENDSSATLVFFHETQSRPPALHGAMDGEEDVATPPVRQISSREWREIENVSHVVKLVGVMFSEYASTLAARKPAPPEIIGWNHEAWSFLNGVAPASKKQLRKIDAIRIKNDTKTYEALRKRAAAPGPLPRMETLGGRLEAYVLGTLLWAERSAAEAPLDVAVSLHKLLGFLRRRVPGVDAEVIRQVEELLARCPPPQELLRLAARNPEKLSRPCFEEPGGLRLHAEQEAVVKHLVDAVMARRPILIGYQTPPSGGKTSAAALLGSVVHHCSLGVRVVYTCFSPVVRTDVCRHLISASVPFAIVTQLIASPSHRCYFSKASRKAAPTPPPDPRKRLDFSLHLVEHCCDRSPSVVVCDLDSAEAWLSARPGDVLLFDEPTADLGPSVREQSKRLLRVAPRHLVLMSATLPSMEELQPLVAFFASKQEDPVVAQVSSTRVPMSITAVDFDGTTWAPHDFGISREDVEKDSHLGRFYSPKVLERMTATAWPEGLGRHDVLSYEGIRAACMDLITGDASSDPRPPLRKIPLGALCTTEAATLTGCSLLIVDCVREFYRSSVSPLLELVPSLRRLQKRAKSACAAAERRRPVEDSDGEVVEPMPAAGPMWPMECVVNSREHGRRHGRVVPPRLVKGAVYFNEGVLETSATTLVESLLSGVAVLGSRQGDPMYEFSAQTAAESAIVSYTVAEKLLIYGTNLPLDRVVLAASEAGGFSHSDMRQLCGRVGRTGLSSGGAEVVFGDLAHMRTAMIWTRDDSNVLMCGDW